MMKPLAAFVLIPMAVAASGCCSTGAEQTDEDPILAAWSQLLPPAGCTVEPGRRPEGVCAPDLVIRTIVRLDAPCPEIRMSGGEQSPPMAERRNPAKNDLKVKVCEATVDRRKSDQASFASSRKKVSWSAFARDDALRRVVIIGDTGCRNEQGQEGCDAGGDRDAVTGRTWSFARVAEAAATAEPGLVIHVGDFRYRHEWDPDSWEDWKKDVFDPAAPLLAAAPWVIARGNHDLCYNTRGGKGYKGNGWPLFFGTDRTDDPKNCRQREEDKIAAPTALPPYALDVAETLRLVVLDSSNSFYQCAKWSQDFDKWAQWGLADLLRPAGGDKADPQKDKEEPKRKVWLVTHYPVWHVEENPASPCNTGEKTGLYAMRAKLAPFLLVPDNRVDAILSGDIHHFEVLQAILPDGTQAGPIEYVAGHGGALPSPLPTSPMLACDPSRLRVFDFRKNLPARQIPIGGIEVTSPQVTLRGRAICGHGFLAVESGGRDWRFTAKFIDAGSSTPTVFSIPAELDGVPADPQLVLTGYFDADVSRLTPHELRGWRVTGGTDGAGIGTVALLACGPSGHGFEALVAVDGQSDLAAIPVSALRRVGVAAVAVPGRTGDQIKTDLKIRREFTPTEADKPIAELGESCKGR